MDMVNAVKSVLADFSSVSPSSKQKGSISLVFRSTGQSRQTGSRKESVSTRLFLTNRSKIHTSPSEYYVLKTPQLPPDQEHDGSALLSVLPLRVEDEASLWNSDCFPCNLYGNIQNVSTTMW